MPSKDMDKEQGQSKLTGDPADCQTVSEADIDAALEGSFPASDPIPWTLGLASDSDCENETKPPRESEKE